MNVFANAAKSPANSPADEVEAVETQPEICPPTTDTPDQDDAIVSEPPDAADSPTNNSKAVETQPEISPKKQSTSAHEDAITPQPPKKLKIVDGVEPPESLSSIKDGRNTTNYASSASSVPLLLGLPVAFLQITCSCLNS